ncbi:hypothetical protein [Tessaracoccus aquimaris]|uniref:hypothetical protein n=1 Tax=Tessaracoccus aquimaris TaxID=1332264 RepID=UPI001314C4B5|nr:hypothetical protein [Tessaracoccus aquimaris]
MGRASSTYPKWYGKSTLGWVYLFLLPGLILSALFVFYPMVASWVFSTMEWSGFTSSMKFIGLGNYVELVKDPLFWGRSAAPCCSCSSACLSG